MPEFNHDAYFPIQEDGAKNIKIDLFDADKLGKDKPIGSINLDIENLVNEGPIEDAWLPLENGKGGLRAKCFVSADIYDYVYVSQGKTKVDSIDDDEELLYTEDAFNVLGFV